MICFAEYYRVGFFSLTSIIVDIKKVCPPLLKGFLKEKNEIRIILSFHNEDFGASVFIPLLTAR